MSSCRLLALVAALYLPGCCAAPPVRDEQGGRALTTSPLVQLHLAAGEKRQQHTATYEVLDVYRHDRQAFTQGLVWHDNTLWESTGLKHRSEVG
jgi:outer membrane biogenesis lipoprotein LolB